MPVSDYGLRYMLKWEEGGGRRVVLKICVVNVMERLIQCNDLRNKEAKTKPVMSDISMVVGKGIIPFSGTMSRESTKEK